MAKKNIHSSNGGEISPKLEGRTDFGPYFNSCLSILNYFVDRLGAAEFRAGFEFVQETKNNGIARLIPFKVSRSTVFQLEFGETYIRFFDKDADKDSGHLITPFESITIDNAAAAFTPPELPFVDIPVTAHPFTIDSEIAIAGSVGYDGTYPVEEGTTTNLVRIKHAHTVETFAGTETILAVTPYLAANLNSIKRAQSADVMYLTDGLNKPRKLSRISNTDWTLIPVEFKEGPFLDVNTDDTLTITPSYPAWADITVYAKDDIVFTVAAAINPSVGPAVDKGSGLVGIPAVNTFTTGDLVTLAGFAAYNGTFELHNTTTATEIVIATTFTIEAFSGLETITKTLFHKSLTNHTSDIGGPPFETPPGNTADWTEALTFTGTNLTLTSSSALFDAGHVGALFKITHPRKDSGLVRAYTAPASTEWIRVSKGTTWSFVSSGLWSGVAEIQRTYDDGTTVNFVKVFTSLSGGESNFTFTGEEDEDGALYRIALTSYTAGSFGLNFNIDEFFTQGIVEITSFTSSTSVGAKVVKVLGNILTTDDWAEGAWSDFRGWPKDVSFFDNRLKYAGTTHSPTGYWLSDAENFDTFTEGIDDDNSISRRLDGDEINEIQWISSLDDIIIGTSGGIWRASSGNLNTPISPTNRIHRRQNREGSSQASPIEINGAFIYIAEDGSFINELLFDDKINAYGARNLNILTDHFFDEDTAEELEVMSLPRKYILARMSSGIVLIGAYDRNQQLMGWSRMVTDGTIESISVLPKAGEDGLWIIANRTIEGATKRYVEKKRPQNFGYSDITDAWHLDSALGVDLGPKATITAITQADPGVVTAALHGLTTTDKVRIIDVLGMDEANGVWEVVVLDPNTFTLKNIDTSTDIDTTLFGAYTSGGTVEQVDNNFTGYGHLEAETVQVLGDGAYGGEYVVSSGEVDTDDYFNRVIIGLHIDSEWTPTLPDFEGGALAGNIKSINKVIIRFLRTVGGQSLRADGVYLNLPFTQEDILFNEANPLFTGLIVHEFDGAWSREENLSIRQNLPLPQTIISVTYDIDVRGV